MRFALWNASENPNPSIVWYFVLKLTVILVAACLATISDPAAAEVATNSAGSAARTWRKYILTELNEIKMGKICEPLRNHSC